MSSALVVLVVAASSLVMLVVAELYLVVSPSVVGGSVAGNVSIQSTGLGSLESGRGKGGKMLASVGEKGLMHTQLLGNGSKHCRGQYEELPSDEMQHKSLFNALCSRQSPLKSMPPNKK